MSNLRQASALDESLVFDDSALKHNFCHVLSARESPSERFIPCNDRFDDINVGSIKTQRILVLSLINISN